MRDIANALNEILPNLYWAASRKQEWTTFVQLLAQRTAASKAHITYLNNADQPAKNGIRQWIKHVGLNDEILAGAVKYGHLDEWWRACTFGPYLEGWVGRGYDLWPYETFLQSEIYRLLLREHDFVRLAIAILLKRPGEIAVCGLIRGHNDDEFDDDVLLFLRELVPHIQTAIHLYNQTGELQQNLDSLELALEQFAIGVVVLDNTSAVIYANSMARSELASEDGLMIHKGKIRTSAARDLVQLRTAIQRAIQLSESSAHGVADSIIGVAPVSRKQGPAFHVFIAPWLTGAQLALTRPAAVMLITRSDRKIPQEAWLQTLYGLTPAESKLAVLIGSGMDGPEAAGTLGLSVETVRTRLKTVFGKTRTRRQSDLARLLASLPPG